MASTPGFASTRGAVTVWRMNKLLALCFSFAAAAFLGNSPSVSAAEPAKEAPIRALIITGGCCHNYEFQSKAMRDGISKMAKVEWTVVNAGGNGTRAEIEFYKNEDWAKPYDVVIHNECFADTDNEEYVKRITTAHKAGKPALVIHCAMHTYRSAKFDDWREFLGVTSRHHEHQSRYPVRVVAEAHPIMQGMPKDWVTPMDELYILEKVWPGTTPLAVSVSERTKKEQAVAWVNNYHGTRVFGTTYGHSDETFADPVFINMLGRALLWSVGKLN